MKFSDVIVVVTGVGWLLWAGWWMWKYHFKPMRARHKIIGARCGICKTPFAPKETRTDGKTEVRLN